MRPGGVQEDTRAINNRNGKQPILEHVVGCGEADVHDTWRKSLQESMFSIYLSHFIRFHSVFVKKKKTICNAKEDIQKWF
jgi:hypothetical protein